MKLFEYEGRELFQKYNIPVPKWGLAKNVNEAIEIANSLGYPVVIKAQVLVGGRGKAGGIRFAYNENELVENTMKILNMKIKEEKVDSVIISKSIDIKKEMFLSIIIDRSIKSPVLLCSYEGGIDIEEIAKKYSEKILKIRIDPLIGIQDYMIRKVENFLQQKNIGNILKNLYKLFLDYDCELVEINPLAISTNDEIFAIDSKIIIDDSALYRQKEFAKRIEREMNEFEREATLAGFNYVEHEGDIGIICNGAGLTMSTMDLVQYYGGKPANFLDIGGGASSDIVYKAIKLQLIHPRVKGIFINILGGITRCDEVAEGIIRALKEIKTDKKIVVRMMGTNEEIGKKMLNENGIYTYDNAEESAKKIVELIKS